MDVDLDGHGVRFDAENGECLAAREHGVDARSAPLAGGSPLVTILARTTRIARNEPIYGLPMTYERQALGRIGEGLVAAELRTEGWRLLDRNARPKTVRGELDLIAWDGSDVVFVEVKTAREGAASGPVNPAELVGRRKQMKLRRLAGAWIRENRERVPRGAGMRIDVVAQRLDRAGRVVWREHIRAAA